MESVEVAALMGVFVVDGEVLKFPDSHLQVQQ